MSADKPIRTYLMLGATIAIFDAAMERFWDRSPRQWVSPEGVYLDYNDMCPVSQQPAYKRTWLVCLSDTLKARAAIVAYAQTVGVLVDFVDGYYTYGTQPECHIGQAFEQFADAVIASLDPMVAIETSAPEGAQEPAPTAPTTQHRGTREDIAERRELVRRLHAANVSAVNIARREGIPLSTVYADARAMGLSFRPESPGVVKT